MAMGMLGMVMSGMAQKNAAQKQQNYQQQLAIQQRDQNYEEQVHARQEQGMKQEEIAREKFSEQLKHRRETSTALTEAAGAGVAGMSVDALISDYNTQYSMNQAALDRQQELTGIISQTNVENVAKDVYIQAPVEVPSTGSVLGGALLGSIGKLF